MEKNINSRIKRLEQLSINSPDHINLQYEMTNAGAEGRLSILKWFKNYNYEQFVLHSAEAVEQAYFCSPNRKKKKILNWLERNGKCDKNYLKNYVGIDNLEKIIGREWR